MMLEIARTSAKQRLLNLTLKRFIKPKAKKMFLNKILRSKAPFGVRKFAEAAHNPHHHPEVRLKVLEVILGKFRFIWT